MDSFMNQLSSVFTEKTKDLISELEVEREKVRKLTKYTKECIDINDEV